ncbi:MAG: hypothetical protein QOI04_1015 [Verrucomicrobiota bacterium]
MAELGASRVSPQDQRARRARSVVQGTASGLLGRGLGFLTSIISIPLTVRYLGSERYGVWITISSALTFLSFTDFGLANSMTNALGRAYGEEDRHAARRCVSSAFFVLCAIAIVVLIAGGSSVAHIANFLFPRARPVVRSEIIDALTVAMSIFALNFPLLTVNRILAAHQESAIANLWAMAGSVANLAAILVVIWFRGGLWWLVLGCSGLGLIINAASAIWLFEFHKPWLRPSLWAVDRKIVRELFSAGWRFFVIGTAWMINSQTDNLVIAHYLGARQVTPYSVTFRLFAIATMLQTLAYPSLWPAYTNAFAQRDFAWIRRTFRSSLMVSFLATLAILIVLVVFGRSIIRLWAGANAVPPFPVIVWMAIWNLMLSTLYVASCLLSATGHLRGMTIYGSTSAVLNLVLSIVLVRFYGMSGVIAGTVISAVVASYLPTFLEVRHVLKALPTTESPAG